MEGYTHKIDPVWRKKDVIGVDISTDSVKVVQLKKTRRGAKLLGYGRMSVPENFVIEGIIAEPEKLAESLKKFISAEVKGRVTASRVCTSVPESKIFTHTMTVPRKSEKELSDAVSWEASQTIPMAMSDLYMDFQVIGPDSEDPTQDVVLYSAAPKAIVNSYVQLFEIMGLELVSIETDLTAIMRSVLPIKHSNSAKLIIDIGRQSTNLAVVDNTIRVTGSTLVGGEQVRYRVSEALGISEENVEKMAEKPSEKKSKKLQESLKVTVDAITKEATRMINFFEQKAGDKQKIQKIILCGGSSSTFGLADLFNAELGISVEVGDPWKNIITGISGQKAIPSAESSLYTTAVGLALLGVIDD